MRTLGIYAWNVMVFVIALMSIATLVAGRIIGSVLRFAVRAATDAVRS